MGEAALSGSRYERLVKIASGGMATVYVGRVRGALGFEQLVAIKRPHPHLMQTPDMRRSLLAEARLASRIRHANAVGVRDVEMEDDSILLVMDYVEGASFQELLRSARTADRKTTIRVGLRVIRDLCAGLQAVHDLTDDEDRLLGAVHRDVSPHNVLVGLDGVSRVADFGIAKCLHSNDTSTREGTLKGKFSYMAPEYMMGKGFDQRADIFAVGVLLWELLTERRLFDGEAQIDIVRKVLMERIAPVSELVPELGYIFDPVLDHALSRDPASRFARASDLGAALEAAIADTEYAGSHGDVARFVREQVGDRLAERKQRIKEGLRASSSTTTSSSVDPVVHTLEVEDVLNRAPTPPPPAESSAVSAPNSDLLPARVPRHAARIALASVAVLLAALGILAVVASRSNMPAPAASPVESAAPARVEPLAPASTGVQLIPAPIVAASASAKASEKIEKTEKPLKPKKPSPPVATAPVPDAPRPRGNPY